MTNTPSLIKNIAALLIFVISTAAVLFLELTLGYPELFKPTSFSSPDIIRFISYFSFSCVVLFSLSKSHTLPLLSLVLVIKLLQFPISLFLSNIDNALYYYLSSALLDLLMAFWIVHYHNDPYLLKLFNAKTHANVPQVYLMSLILAISSLVSCLQSVEYVIYNWDRDFYKDSVPFLYQYQHAIKLTLNTLFEVCIWSLLLDPNRWKILQKIQNKFLAP